MEYLYLDLVRYLFDYLFYQLFQVIHLIQRTLHYMQIIALLTDTTKIDKRIEELNGEISDTKTLVENLIHDNALKAQD